MSESESAHEPGVWRKHAAQWARVGPPLRPSEQDGQRMSAIVDALVARHGTPSVLVLGVTPELARLSWPQGTDLLAVDHAAEMIRKVWPGYPSSGEGALLANWLDMELPGRSRDLVVSDGCFAVLSYSDQHRALLQVVRRLLRPHGQFAFRLFIRPQTPETPQDVYRAVMSGEIGGFHAFKMRLLMAVQPDSLSGVVTGDVWENWHAHGPSPEDLAARTTWPLEQIATIDAYKGQDTVYCFPLLAEIRALLEEEAYVERDCAWPTYELGERCPTLLVEPLV